MTPTLVPPTDDRVAVLLSSNGKRTWKLPLRVLGEIAEEYRIGGDRWTLVLVTRPIERITITGPAPAPAEA